MPRERFTDSFRICESRITSLKSAIRGTVEVALTGFSLDPRCQAIDALGVGTGVAFEPSGIKAWVYADGFTH
jgi:hypothetical protein